MAEPGSDHLEYVDSFVQKVKEATGGRIEIKVYPANQLGDWTEVHEQVMPGAVDMASQSLSTKFEKAMDLTWVPYNIPDSDTAREAFPPGGLVYEVISGDLAKTAPEILVG